MKLLHTADWHVGRPIRGRSRADEHEAVLDEIATIAADHAVDVVLVAGDLFETAAPAPESERIVYRALLDLADTGATVVVVAGNHDSDRRLQAVEPLLTLGRVVTRPVFDRSLLEVTSRDGDETALIAAVPFLSQRWVVRVDDLLAEGADAAAHAQQYAERMRRVVQSVTAGFGAGTINIVVAHCMVAGGALGGGERPAHTVFEYAVDPSAFPTSAHYVALGHLHRRQRVPGPCPIEYSGSPLQLDFGETQNEPSVTIVDAAVGRPARVEAVALRRGRRLSTVVGTLVELRALAAEGSTGDDHLKVVVREKLRAGLADEVRSLFPTCVDVAVERADEWGERAATTSRRGRTPHQLFAQYLDEHDVADEGLLPLFDELYEEAG
jgi:DNA repair protein SbcD/Mre11